MNEKVINLLGIRKTVILCHTNDISKDKVIMRPITKTDEDILDEYHKNPDLPKDNPSIRNVGSINPRHIFLYGEVDFNNKNDLESIERLNLVDLDKGGWVYSNFNFDKGNYSTVDKISKRYPTFNPIKWFMFNYVLIGKPKRVIVYKVRDTHESIKRRNSKI